MRKVFLLFYLIFLGAALLSAHFKASLRGGVAFGPPAKKPYYNLDIVLGYQFENSFYIGVGAGLNNSYAEQLYWTASYSSGQSRDIGTDRLLPLFARVKYNLDSARISPFVAIDAGYLVAATGQVLKRYQGFFGIPAVGVDFFVDKRRRHCFSVQIGVLIQEFDWFDTKHPADGIARPDLKVSFTF